MATRQGIDSSITSRLGADQQAIFFAVEAKFDTDTIRLWTGDTPITIGGNSYLGAGTLLSISDMEDTQEVKSTNISISLSAMDKSVTDLALSEDVQNRVITVFMGFLMGNSPEAAGTMTMFKGRMTSIQMNDTPEGSTITVNAENRLVDLNRPCNLRYSVGSQAFIDSNDTGFKYVAEIQDKNIDWGRPGGSYGGGGGGSDSGGNDNTSDSKYYEQE